MGGCRSPTGARSFSRRRTCCSTSASPTRSRVTRYPGTPQTITAIANNELEVASLAYSSFAIAIENAGLDDLRVIADEFQDGVPGYYTDQYYVRKDSGINKVEDLKGKVIGTNGGGSAVDVAIRAMLHKHGLEEKRDYTMLEGPLPAMPAMLLEKKADLIPAVLPFAFNPKLREDGKVLFNQTEALGVTQMIILAARKSFIDKNRAAMVDFMEDLVRVVHWYLDPKNHDEVAKIASKITKVPPERFGWLFTKQDTYRDPDLLPNLDALQTQRRHHARARLREKQNRREDVRRLEFGEGSGRATEKIIA